MHYIKFILAFLVVGSFSNCHDHTDDPTDHTTELTMTFKATYDGVLLEKYKTYNYDTYKVQFSQFNTFLSNISLVKGTTETLVSEVELLNFTPSSAPDDKSVEITIKATVPGDDYTGLKIGYGVKPELNAKKPADFAANHPLNAEVEYWPGWKSFIFNKIEGQGDSDGDNIDDIFMVLHCGSDKVYREFTFNKDISTHTNTTVNVEFDLKKLFFADNIWWDLTKNENQATSNLATDVRVATALMDNFDNATVIK